MNEPEVVIALRTFSGPNLGAEVMLPPGTYSIGTDYSCDVVFGDSSIAPRHAALTVEATPPGYPPRVHVKPLDSAVMLEEEPLPAEGWDVPPATPWFLGLTCLSWNTPHAPREEIVPRLPGQPTQTPPKAEPETLVDQDIPSRERVLPDSNVVGDEPTTTLPRTKRWILRLVVLLLLIALGALSFEFQTPPGSTEELVAKLRQEIKEAGLDKVLVTGENGRIIVSGTVLDEKERGRIWTMARNLKYPVYIRIGVREDMAQAVKMKLNSSGIFPEVTFPGGGDSMHIAAYIRDIQTEAATFASLNKDMPGLPKFEKLIVHATQLRSFIEQELDLARLQKINLSFGTGRIELTDTSLSGNHEALQRVMKRIEEKLSIPLAYTIISQDSPRAEAAALATEPLVPGGISPDMPATPVSPGNSPLAGVQITGVTMGPMRFISLGNGQRIFEGGMLPGGHVLESISLDILTLSKNGRITTYPLRGNNE